MNLYGFNPEIISCQSFVSDQEIENPSFQNYNNNDQQLIEISAQVQPFNNECQIVPYHHHLSQLQFDSLLDPTEVPDIPDTCFNYINDLLREEYHSQDDYIDTPNSTLEDYMAAQMSYKSLDVAASNLLGENNFSFPFSANNLHQNPPSDLSQTCLDDYYNMFSSIISNSIPLHSYPPSVISANHSIVHNTSFVGNLNDGNFGCSLPLVESCNGVGSIPAPVNVINGGGGGRREGGGGEANHSEEAAFAFLMNDINVHEQGNMNLYTNTATLFQDQSGNSNVPISGNGGSFTDNSRRRKHDEGENNQDTNGRNNKNLAPSNDDVKEQIEQYGDVILCPEGRSKPGALCNNRCKPQNSGDDSSKVSKKRGNKVQVVDLRGLLTRCAQCVAQVDLISAYEMLKQIRQHSSPHGDFLQRVAHYLANGLEARLEGNGLELTHVNKEISPSEVLKANRIYVASVPFQIMSFYTMNKTIAGLVEEAPSIHIIDFGIYYGLQWPCIIQNLSKRPNGPPRIRITGIDLPQEGFRPSEKIEETGRCLAKYCEKYNVPFEYCPIAKKWEDVQLEELKIERNEPLVVNCLYRAHQLFDESVEENSPRDKFLKLVKKISPDIFLHAVVNSTSSVPFFLNRFKEAMFHYSALFDIFESTMSREDSERLLLESKLYGPQALNVIACEGIERVERPESYKQWQIRTQRAGFKQVGLDRELLRRARAMVRRSFRPEFSYDEDGFWVVQGWKGRILYAISCWKPV
ncbi:scarecrow-like protein 30 [Beta vulgaris subsp. vulgaris]|uniref:scarecrow-like protein 30 n=1 Tax=Beta vulgaris subsp. vulgaris TaxID=3555 RepID=UPI002036F067|nr:scarecrow-like protein 30 [Beta vulgaris subsp. vulgaris]